MRIHKEITFLIIFCIVYYIINAALYISMSNAGSSALEYVIVFFPIFWIIASILLFILIKLLKIRLHNIGRKILVICSTPLLCILFVIINAIYQPPPPEYKYHDSDKKRQKEVIYFYKSGKVERKEFYKRKDRFDWEKDSIWIYYDRRGQIIRTEQY
jgi:hypothetical protein